MGQKKVENDPILGHFGPLFGTLFWALVHETLVEFVLQAPLTVFITVLEPVHEYVKNESTILLKMAIFCQKP